jgi:tRNA modification GTPase
MVAATPSMPPAAPSTAPGSIPCRTKSSTADSASSSRAPHSYTGNDLVEFQCHGGAAVVRRLLAAAVRLGARPAEPGEFTRRAFLNGRMDLAQAEAVADIVRAETDAAARAAQAQLAGGLSARVTALRERLIDLAAEIEARIDFPDEDLGDADRARLDSDFLTLADGLTALVALRGRGRLLREGLRVALVGPPNVGKSSLLNALARTERAIVTPHPGTTRDTVECLIDLAGVPVTLIDTAGIRESADPIEALGIERSRRVLADADIVLEIRDAAAPVPIPPFRIPGRPPDLVVENKIDLITASGDQTIPTQPDTVRVSASTGAGLDTLERRLMEKIQGDGAAAAGRDAFAINERHARLLDAALAAVSQARPPGNPATVPNSS